MNRLTDNDIKFGRFVTIARWKNNIRFELCGGDDEDPENLILVVLLGWALRIQIPTIIKPFGKYQEHRREYGFSICKDGKYYDFLSISYGPQTHDSSTTKSWSYFLPWTQKRHVRTSLYNPDGSHFYDEIKRKWDEFYQKKQECPSSRFEFKDYDGKIIIATCIIEEREWHHGEGWFKWLGWFIKPSICKSLEINFSEEVGKEKGSWKGGAIGHGINMLPGETPEDSFRRYCDQEHRSKSGKYKLTFLRSL
jgi:hypothetical protein